MAVKASVARQLNALRKFRIRGLCCATVTPFKENGDLNLDIIPKYVDHLKGFGIRNLFVNGTTGEGNSLTVAERKQTAEAWVKESAGKLSDIIIHIGTGNLRESQELARHAQEIGAHAISCVSSTYFKPVCVEDYVDYMRQVAAAAPKLPFYLYDINFVTGVYLDVPQFFEIAKDCIPNLCGLKHTTPDFNSMHTLRVNYGDEFQVLLGSDELYLEALAVGISETIMNSFTGKVLTRLKEAFDKGDMKAAREEQARATKMGRIKKNLNLQFPAISKAMLKVCAGLDMGPTRPPIQPATPQQVETLKKDLQDVGYFEWGTK